MTHRSLPTSRSGSVHRSKMMLWPSDETLTNWVSLSLKSVNWVTCPVARSYLKMFRQFSYVPEQV